MYRSLASDVGGGSAGLEADFAEQPRRRLRVADQVEARANLGATPRHAAVGIERTGSCEARKRCCASTTASALASRLPRRAR
jgi:hypothetical protein